MLSPETEICPFLNQRKEENDRRMINLYKTYMAELGFELATPESAVRFAADCAMEVYVIWKFLIANTP